MDNAQNQYMSPYLNIPKPGAIHGKMAAILKDMDAIGKDSENKQQGFKYRGIDDVYNVINPILAKHAVFMTAQVVGKTREERPSKNGGVLAFTSLHMRYRFYAEDGSFVETEAEGEGMDSGDKSSNKAMAIAHKYAILQAFCVPTKDLVDPDSETHERAHTSAPEGVTRIPTADRKAKAKKWGEDQLALIPTLSAKEFPEWQHKWAAAVAATRDVNEALHRRLTDAVLKRQLELSQIATAAE